MVKKYSIINKRQWLETFEQGYSESYIASKNHCDVRTVKKGLEEARHEREAGAARIELLKAALLDHQERLKDKLRDISSSLDIPARDWTVLPWYRNGEFTLTRDDSENRDKPFIQEDVIYDLLKEHLKYDKLWKVLTSWERAYSSHRNSRIDFQGRIVSILEEDTGLKLDEGKDIQDKFLYSYTAGDLFYKMTLRWAFGNKNTDWLDNIIADQDTGEVRYQSNTLAIARGKENECREALVGSFKEMRSLPENTEVVDSYNKLEQATAHARRAIEELLVLGIVPGRCSVCRRLGM